MEYNAYCTLIIKNERLKIKGEKRIIKRDKISNLMNMLLIYKKQFSYMKSKI